MLKRLLVGIVGFSARARWLVVAIAVGVAAYSAFFVRQNFAIDTNINNLISHNLPWRQHQAAYLKAFPGQETSILAVIDAPTPELAQSAAARLSKALLLRRDEIRNAQDVRGSAFFRRNGLLYLSDEELSSILRQLARSGPLLGSLVSDPSLRGIMSSIDLSLRGVRFRRISLDTLAPQFRGLTDAIDNTLSGKPAYFSWTAQLQAAGPKPQTRQFVTISPVLDFNALEPGREATDAIRQTVDDLKLPEQGVTSTADRAGSDLG